MQAAIRIVWTCVFVVALGWVAPTSHAITITYVNPGPSDGVVYGGFTNDLPVPSLVPVNPGGNAFRHLGNNKFKFNLKTNHQVYLPGYSYKIVVDVAGVPVGEAFFALR